MNFEENGECVRGSFLHWSSCFIQSTKTRSKCWVRTRKRRNMHSALVDCWYSLGACTHPNPSGKCWSFWEGTGWPPRQPVLLTVQLAVDVTIPDFLWAAREPSFIIYALLYKGSLIFSKSSWILLHVPMLLFQKLLLHTIKIKTD